MINNNISFNIYSFSKWEVINNYSKILEASLNNLENKNIKINSFYNLTLRNFLKIFLNLIKLSFLVLNKNNLKRNFFIFGSFSLLNIFLCLILSKIGYRTIFLLHDVEAHVGAGIKTILTNLLNRVILFSKTEFIVFSKYSSNILNRKYSSIKNDIYIIPLYSFLEESTSYKRSIKKEFLHSFKNNFNLIIFGRNEPYKRFDFILKNASKISKNTNIKWLFIGNGMSKLKNFKKSKSERILIRDCYYSAEELISHLQRSSLTLIAYEEMTQSAVLFDAMALGLDIYCLNFPFIDEIKDYPGLTIFDSRKLMFISLRNYQPLTLERRLNSIKFYKNNFSKDKVKLESNNLIINFTKVQNFF